MQDDEDGNGATIRDLRRKGEHRHMNGNYKGAYEAFRKAARLRPKDRELWDEYAKAYSNLQQQMEDRQATVLAGYSSISHDLISSMSPEETFAPEATMDMSEVASQSNNWKRSGSILQAVNELEPRVSKTFVVDGNAEVGPRVALSETYMLKEAVWRKNKFQLGAYAMWFITVLLVCFHFIRGWLAEMDIDPLEPAFTLAVLVSALVLLWRFGQSFASGMHNSSKALSAFALAVITVGHWAAFWTEVQEASNDSNSTNCSANLTNLTNLTAAIVFF